MAIRSVFAFSVLFVFTYCDAKAENCSEARCKLLPVGKDFASEFRNKAVEKGVRMIYLQLKIGNDSYDPLQAPNEFLPYRWVWTPTISEHLLSLPYDYDILSLGLLKRQVREMDVKLEDKPSGCLAGLNSSCQDIVVSRTLLGNVTARNGSGGIHSSEDVVCIAEIDKYMNFFENFLESNVKFRCCKVVDDQGRRINFIPECDLRVSKSNWYKAFFVVLNVLTIFVGLYSPAILFLLPDYIFGLRKECEKEHQQEEEPERNGYLPIPSSQEKREESINVTDVNAMASEGMMLSRMRRQSTLAEDHTNVIEEPDTNELNANEATENEANLNGPNSNEHNLNEPTSGISLNSSTNDKGKDEEEERKLDEIPVDDGNPVNISTLLHACASAEVFRHHSTKFSFNIKLAFLWLCVIPFPFYIELALGYILKDEYLEETGRKNTVIQTGGLFVLFDSTQTGNWVILIISYLIIPLLIILILRPEDFSAEHTRVPFLLVDYKFSQVKSNSSRVFIGDIVLQRFKESKRLLILRTLLLGKVPIHVYQAVQNSCDKCKKTRAQRLVRLIWVLLALISSICAVICSVIMAAICLLLILLLSTLVLVCLSPYFAILFYVIRYKVSRRFFFSFPILILAGVVMLLFSHDKPLLIMINPITYLLSTVCAPFLLILSSSRFVIKMCGYTIMGLIYNAGIAAPVVVFFATSASYLRDRYLDSKNQCKRVKAIISQEWQQGIKHSLETGELNDEEKPEVVSDDAIPKKLFWYVCDGVKYQVFPLESEALRLLRDVAIIFFTAFLALCAIFFSTNSYKISTVASTIAVFVSAKIPMVLLRENDNFNGWKKIKTKRIIREAVGTYIDEKKWLQPTDQAVV